MEAEEQSELTMNGQQSGPCFDTVEGVGGCTGVLAPVMLLHCCDCQAVVMVNSVAEN